MKLSKTNLIFQLRKVLIEIKEYEKEWRYTDDFEKLVFELNHYSRELDFADFQFKNFHYSSTGKTINDTGYKALINHITITEEMLNSLLQSSNGASSLHDAEVINNKKVFIVHGRNKNALLETEGILHRSGLEPIVLNRMVNSGLTLIEKFEKNADVMFAIVLLTPDDIGALFEEGPIESLSYKYRARQNVLFELGFFYGKLGRSKVCCILKANVEKPSDIDGIAYLPYQNSIEEIEYALLKELKNANLNIKDI
ncbi:TIR domain-containing protein [Planococcus kocurii]|uniref:TIR domain-containing protein n=1 Tax=Planococcus kocurii TaxID=1374 RepID=UPI003D07149D